MICRHFFVSVLLCFLTLLGVRVEKSLAFTPLSRQQPLKQRCDYHNVVGGLSEPPPFSRHASSLIQATRRVNDEQDDDEARVERELAALKQSLDRDGKTRAVGRGRAGGRKRRIKKPVISTQTSSNKNPWNNWFVKANVPVLVIALFLKSLFGGSDEAAPNASPSYFYYQSSYYESRVYTGDGNVQRTYKQSIQSNVPSLIEGRKLLQEDTRAQSSESQASRSTQFLLRESPDRGLDQELDAALMKVQQAMFNDWYY